MQEVLPLIYGLKFPSLKQCNFSALDLLNSKQEPFGEFADAYLKSIDWHFEYIFEALRRERRARKYLHSDFRMPATTFQKQVIHTASKAKNNLHSFGHSVSQSDIFGCSCNA